MTGVIFWLMRMPEAASGSAGYGIAFLFAAVVRDTAVLLVAAALVAALRRDSAATRHLTWTLALAATLAVPILYLTVPAWKVPLLPPSATHGAKAEGGSRALSGACVQTNFAPGATGDAVRPTSAAQRPASDPAWMRWIVYLWAGGVLILAVFAAIGEFRARKLVRRLQRLGTCQAKSVLDRLSRTLEVSQAVELRSGCEVSVPCTRGVFPPVILLPSEARHWSQEQLEFVLAHELAHVRRCDWLTQMLAHVTCALFWFQPLVWIAAREMRKEREGACDDVVLSLGHEATDYAEIILRLARKLRRTAPAWSVGVCIAQPSRLEVRMKALLDPRLNHRPLTASRVLLLSLLALVLLLPAAAIQATVKSSSPNGILLETRGNEKQKAGAILRSSVLPSVRECASPESRRGSTANIVSNGNPENTAR